MKHKPRMDRLNLSTSFCTIQFTNLQEAELDKWVLIVCTWWMVDVLCADRLPQQISCRATLKTRQNQPDHCRNIPAPISLRNRSANQHTNSNDTQLTHLPFLYLFLQLFLLCVCVMLLWFWLMLTWSCVFMARCKTWPICTIFCSLSLARSLGVFVLFHFGCLNVCFAACIWCCVQHIT